MKLFGIGSQFICQQVEVFYEQFSRAERFLSLDPGVFGFLTTLPGLSALKKPTGIARTAEGALYYRLTLPGLYHIRQGFELKATALSCSATAGKRK